MAAGGELPAPQSRALAIAKGIPTAGCFLVARCQLAQVASGATCILAPLGGMCPLTERLLPISGT